MPRSGHNVRCTSQQCGGSASTDGALGHVRTAHHLQLRVCGSVLITGAQVFVFHSLKAIYHLYKPNAELANLHLDNFNKYLWPHRFMSASLFLDDYEDGGPSWFHSEVDVLAVSAVVTKYVGCLSSAAACHKLCRRCIACSPAI